MSEDYNRRRFLKTSTTAGMLAPVFGMEILHSLPVVSASETRWDSKMVRFDSGIEPLVNFVERTPREKLIEELAQKIRGGTSYQSLLAALFLAAVRNVQPRPSVGFKFHAVLVVNAAHIASLASPPQDRWLPILWAYDYFKSKQLEEERTSGWKLPPVKESQIPSGSTAKKEFLSALETWDEQKADTAVAGMARTAGANEIFEILFRYGSRDYRSIGHKAIFVANARRTLMTIGWHHAEPVLRSLVYALLNHRREPNPSKNDLVPDRPYRRNLELVKTFRSDYRSGQLNANATKEMLHSLHSQDGNEVCDRAVKLINGGVSPQSIWDAVLLGAGELLMRQPGIIGIHALTTSNAMHFAFSQTGDDETRKLLLLQNCAFLTMFRRSAGGRGKIADRSVADLKPVEMDGKNPREQIAEIFHAVSSHRMTAAGKVRQYLASGGFPQNYLDSARRLIFSKGRDAHDYKYSSAVLEDYSNVSPAFRNDFLAMSVFNLKGSADRDNPLVQRIRNSLGST